MNKKLEIEYSSKDKYISEKLKAIGDLIEKTNGYREQIERVFVPEQSFSVEVMGDWIPTSKSYNLGKYIAKYLPVDKVLTAYILGLDNEDYPPITILADTKKLAAFVVRIINAPMVVYKNKEGETVLKTRKGGFVEGKQTILNTVLYLEFIKMLNGDANSDEPEILDWGMPGVYNEDDIKWFINGRCGVNL